MNLKILITAISVVLLVLVASLAFIAYEANLPETAALPNSSLSPFGAPVTFSIGQQKTFTDGLQVTLTAINDSRCKTGVVCVWAGELSPQLSIINGSVGASAASVNLGTVRATSAATGGYNFILNNATETTATITVTKNSQASCFVGGCSNQLCGDQPGAISTCEYRAEYACYKTARCERQENGQCGWTQTVELTSCLMGK